MFPSIKSPLKGINVHSTRTALYLSGFDSVTCTYRLMIINRPKQMEQSQSEEDVANIQIVYDPQSYTQVALDKYIRELSEATTVETLCVNADCMFGLIKLLESYYLIMVTKKKKVASLHGHSIYTITETQTIPITYRLSPSAEENKYRSILQYTDLTKNFYFSYTYDITNTMQNSFIQYQQQVGRDDGSTWHTSDDSNDGRVRMRVVRDMFVWNTYALKPFLSNNTKIDSTNVPWLVPVIHGFVKQRTFRLSSGILMKYTLIARRSRIFAGTRYLRRGVNVDGYVANEVESESIFTRETTAHGLSPRSSALVQLRGSIPLMWGNTSFTSMKPDIRIEDEADPQRTATRAHIKHMTERYGEQITFLSLVRQKESKPKEQLVAKDLVNAMDFISERAPTSLIPEAMPMDKSYSKLRFKTNIGNGSHLIPVNICSYDFLNANHDDLFSDIEIIQESAFPSSGFFVQPPQTVDSTLQNSEYISFPLDEEKNIYDEILQNHFVGETLKSISSPSLSSKSSTGSTNSAFGDGFPKGLLQTGVFRTNCIDCLDRTNVGMFIYAKISTYRQLRALGVDLTSNGLSNLWAMMTGIWAEHGDTIANQYAGSGAMHRVEAQSNNRTEDEYEIKVVGGLGNALVAAKRYYSNASTDFDRQQSMDLLLGIFVPKRNSDHIWMLKEVLEDKRTSARRASDALTIMKHDNNQNLQAGSEDMKEQQFRRASLLAATQSSQTLTRSILMCIIDPRPKNIYYDDIDQASLSLTRFEDELIVSDYDTLGADNLQSTPYSTQIRESEANYLKRYESYVPGYVEQDLYFGRRGTTLQENLYGRYCRLENIPLYAPCTTIFDNVPLSMEEKRNFGGSQFKPGGNSNINHNSPRIYDNNSNDTKYGRKLNRGHNVVDRREPVVESTVQRRLTVLGLGAGEELQSPNAAPNSDYNESSNIISTTSRLAAWFSSKAKKNGTNISSAPSASTES